MYCACDVDGVREEELANSDSKGVGDMDISADVAYNVGTEACAVPGADMHADGCAADGLD